ncbi:hypothetical protein [Bordetella sp. FB-8]|uniref:hypothetical protein n=1 Tax=Bordetella sp. FB-8 TaxID=1159870 RepID=UPI000369C683|nr:hypothetical protein [Bordetella sp. FB-8]
MLIVLAGALPDAPIASELARHLPQRAPTLHAWLAMGQANLQDHDPHARGCTPFEAWQLEHAGYAVQPGLPWGAGLGPLLAGKQACRDGRAVWLGELVHLALGTDRAALLPAGQMDLSVEESQALLEAARPLFQDTGFSAEPLDAQRWRLFLPEGLNPETASPQAVAGQPLDAWWQHDASTRPWRRLLNEIQMAWHEHPVNESRAARGMAPVNALWLYGGAHPWPAPERPDQARILDSLLEPQRLGDWATWLNALEDLDRNHLAPLARGKYLLPASDTEILLLGDRRQARLRFKPRAGLLRWLPPTKTNWNTWWSRPV